MKNCLTILLLGVLNISAMAQIGFIRDFQEKWSNSMEYTLEVAEAMPAEYYDFKPTEEQMTFREQLLHMAGNMNWLSRSYFEGETLPYDLKKGDYSKEELLTIVKEAYIKTGASVKGVTQEELEEKVDFFAGPKTKRQIINLMNDHSTHHRGQILIYLRLKDVKPPRYRGW